MTDSKIRVVVADDHPAVILGVLARLRNQPLLHVVGTADSFASLRELLSQHAADVVVLDLVGMGEAPLAMVRHLQERYPTTRVVVFSSVVDRAPELLEAGALGYIVKTDPTSQLAEAVIAAHSGQRMLSGSVASYLAMAAQMRTKIELSHVELSVLHALSEGHPTEYIAAQLAADPRTVLACVTGLLRKTGCFHRGELVTWFRTQACLA